MSEESSENKIYLMIDMDEECVFHGENNTIEKPNAIAAYADIDELSEENYINSKKRKDINIPKNGIIEIDRSNLKENNFYFLLLSETRIANFSKRVHVQFDSNENFYYMKFDEDAKPIKFEDNSIIKAFDSAKDLNAFKEREAREKAEQEPKEEAEKEKKEKIENTIDNTETNKSKWIFMIAGGLLVVAGIAMSFLTFGFGVIPFGTTMAALSVAIPSVLGTALVTGASTQFDKSKQFDKSNKKKGKFAIAAIALGAVLTLSAILLSVFTFGLGIGAVAFAGAVTAGFAIGIPAALGVSSIIAGSITYDRLQKNGYSPIDNKSSDNIVGENSIIYDENGRPVQERTVNLSQNQHQP